MATQGITPQMQFLAQSGIATAQNTENQTALAAANQTIQDAGMEKESNIQDEMTASMQIGSAKNALAAANDKDNAQAKQFLGLDPNASNFRLQSLAQTREDAYNKTNEIAATIAQKKSSTLLNDPLGYILNQFTLPADIAQHNYYATLHNNSEAEYDGIVDSGTKTGIENSALKASTSAALQLGNQALIQANAEKQISDVKLESARLGIGGITALGQLQERDLTNSKMVLDAQDTQVRIQMQQAAAAASNAQRALINEERARKIAEGISTTQENQRSVDNYNLAASAYGFGTLPAFAVLAGLKRGDPRITANVTMGEELGINGAAGKTGIPVAGSSAGAAAYYLANKVRPDGNDASTVSYLTNAYGAAASNPQLAAVKDPQARSTLINAAILDDAKNKSELIDPKDTSNPYAARSIAAITTAVPYLQSNFFIRDNLMPLAASSPNTPTSPEQVLGAAVAAVQKDPTKLNEAVTGITQFYQAAVFTNNKIGGLAENSLPTQKSYTTKVNGAGIVGGDANINLTDKIAVQSYIMRQAWRATPFIYRLGLAEPNKEN